MLSSQDSTPSGAELFEAEPVDEVRLFLLYAMTGGDVNRTAILSRVDAKRIASLAHDFNWKGKLAGRLGIDTDQGQESERVLNRISNYVTAQRFQRVVGKLVDELDRDPQFARAFATSVTEDGETKTNLKNFVDLAKCMQIVNDVSYRALQDKQAQAADVINGSTDGSSLALATYKALAQRFDRIDAVDTSVEIAKAVAETKHESEEKKAE